MDRGRPEPTPSRCRLPEGKNWKRRERRGLAGHSTLRSLRLCVLTFRVAQKRPEGPERFRRLFKLSGRHGTRTHSPLRGTSVPVKLLTNSLTVRIGSRRSARGTVPPCRLDRSVGYDVSDAASVHKFILKAHVDARLCLKSKRENGRATFSLSHDRGMVGYNVVLAPLISLMNSSLLSKRPSCLVNCSIASQGCMLESVRRSIVTAS